MRTEVSSPGVGARAGAGDPDCGRARTRVEGSGRRGPVGVLALQGSFPLHIAALRRLGTGTREVRTLRDLEGLRGLIIPGGESTVMAHLARQYGLFEPLKDLAASGLPMFGTCAGAILLGRGAEQPPRLEAVPLEVTRNAYGRQVDSFSADVPLLGWEASFHCIFIRAPKIRVVSDPAAEGALRPDAPRAVEVLGTHGEDPILVRSGAVLLATFHPELTDDLRIHELFLERVVTAS